MTKEQLRENIKAVINNSREIKPNLTEEGLRLWIARGIAMVFVEDSPRFKFSKFMKECGDPW